MHDLGEWLVNLSYLIIIIISCNCESLQKISVYQRSGYSLYSVSLWNTNGLIHHLYHFYSKLLDCAVLGEWECLSFEGAFLSPPPPPPPPSCKTSPFPPPPPPMRNRILPLPTPPHTHKRNYTLDNEFSVSAFRVENYEYGRCINTDNLT